MLTVPSIPIHPLTRGYIMPESLTRIAVLKRFFCEPGTSLKDFLMEVRVLSNDEKEELGTLAAVELGVEIKTGV